MTVDPPISRARRGSILAATAVLLLGSGISAAAESPFAGLSGSWSGSGTVTYASGTTEHLSCRVKYDRNNAQASEDSVQQTLRCASDSYKFQINAYYRNQAGTVTGHWDELVLDIHGSITGSVTAGKITGNLHGPTFLASVLVDTRGNEQTVIISAEDKDIRQVSVAVRRK